MSRLILRTLHPTTRPLRLPISSRPFSSTFDPAPAPPRLPAAQQAEFERLQREAEARLSTHTAVPLEPSSPLQTSRHTTSPSSQPPQAAQNTPGQQSAHQAAAAAQGGGAEEVVLASADGEATFSGGIRKGAPPEFEGDRNPRTGEVGGPKNEPLRWGGDGDWSYNGRVTDF
ncbi:DUF1674-domain-containing protein [Coniochaeta sp. PMI_546]|nr:DUF1674-domain-containing protein [Coniochaeta sp. PMI_546]